MDSLLEVIDTINESTVHIVTDRYGSPMGLNSELHNAVKEDNAEEVRILIQKGADVNAVIRQETAFTRAVDEGRFNAADVVIDARTFDPNAGDQFDRTPLFVAASKGKLKYVNRLLEMGVDVNSRDINGVTPLATTALQDSHEIAHLLIQHGADINATCRKGFTPLYRACNHASINLVKLLLNHNCDVNKADNENITPLMVALPSYYNMNVRGKKISTMLDICKLLIQAGCDVDSQDTHGRTALHHAVYKGDPHGMCLLAESDCNLNLKDKNENTPFQFAIQPGQPNYELARFLLYYGADATLKMKDPRGNGYISPLTLVLRSKSSEPGSIWSRALLLRALCDAVYPGNGPQPAVCQEKDTTAEDENLTFTEEVERNATLWLNSSVPCPLQHSARLKIKQLLGCRNQIVRTGELHIAAKLKQYLNLGLRSNWIPLSKICQLHMHIHDDDNEKLLELIKKGVCIDTPLNDKTPLALALENKNEEAARILLQNNARTQMLNASGDTALHIAARCGLRSLIPEIIAHNHDMDLKNKENLSPLEESVLEGHFDTMADLIKNGADITKYNRKLSLLHLAAASGAVEAVQILLEKGMDPNLQDEWGNTPLHVAASKGMAYLLKDISLPALYGDSLLASLDSVHIAIMGTPPSLTKHAPHKDIVECLLRHGSDPKKVNQEQQTPARCAQEYRANDIMEILPSDDSSQNSNTRE